jgi:hypothetical protein
MGLFTELERGLHKRVTRPSDTFAAMNAYELNGSTVGAKEQLRVFVFYNEFFAGVMAKRLADWIGELAGEDWSTETEIWKLDSIPVIGPLMNAVVAQASEADILIVATSENLPPSAATRWLNSMSAACGRSLSPILLIALPPANEGPRAGEFSNSLAALAARTGLKFLRQQVTASFPYDFDSLQEHFEAILSAKNVSQPATIH